jgi:glutathionylspermidine synthase
MKAKGITEYAIKSIFGREGANITLNLENNKQYQSFDAGYDEGFIYQQLCKQTSYDGYYIVIGGWIVGKKSAAISVREDKKMVTTNTSQFVPHFVSSSEK